MTALPIHDVLPQLRGALAAWSTAVLIAPPGAGKTTAVAPALLGEAWCDGTIVILSPRRIAARAAAERMAAGMGQEVGETVGYLTRLDRKRSARTRILVVTEAIFVAMIVSDPDLAGISAILFDEAHERHLDSDLGLALAIESALVLRPDLRLLVMSATIDGARFARLLGEGTPIIESEGKAYPLAIRWLGGVPERRIEDALTAAILIAWREQPGDILAFLPGVREIEHTRERLVERLPDVPILPLHGQVEPDAQRLALRRDPADRRRIVLATAIAETSLTLDGVSVVVDSGLSRRAEFDIAAGTTRLVTTRASQAAAAQRAGRAARQGPGVAYRLWEEAAHAGRPAFDPPEMLTADLAPLALTLAQWGAPDAGALAWLDPPPASALQAAVSRLEALGAMACDEQGIRITSRGRHLAELPMSPAHAAMLYEGAERGMAQQAAELVLLLQERGLGGRGEDLATRLTRWRADRSPRATAAAKLATGLADRVHAGSAKMKSARCPLGIILAAGLPDNVARRRNASSEHWLSAGGRGYVLDPTSPLARAEWLAIGDAQGQAKGARITAALALDTDEVEEYLAHRIGRRAVCNWNADARRVEARIERRLGAIKMSSAPDPQPDQAAVETLLRDMALADLVMILPMELMARARHAGIGTLDVTDLAHNADLWLAPLLIGRRDLALPRAQVTEALLGLLDWDARQRLDRLAPRSFASPAGSTHPIDYAAEGGPAVEVRVQALFGLDTHPIIGHGTPLLLQLTSPAGRPLQATRDLPGFWRGSWRDVAREMKGRYPRHRWPEQPWLERPSLKTKNALARSAPSAP